jgi:CheY-like chemotaxis protein
VPYTLLLADDSVTIQRVIELTFADQDVTVVAVGDGDQAIERIEASAPDIVLADIGMPGRNGYEVAQYIRRSPSLSHIPVVLLTGAFEPVDQARADDAGCDGVLAKPFEPQLVISRVKELLARPQPGLDQTTRHSGDAERGAEAAAAVGAAPTAEPVDISWAPPTPQPQDPGAATLAAAELPSRRAEPPPDLTDYFDQLDAAFSRAKPAAAAPAPRAVDHFEHTPPPPAASDRDWYAALTDPGRESQAETTASSPADPADDLAVSFAALPQTEAPPPAASFNEPTPVIEQALSSAPDDRLAPIEESAPVESAPWSAPVAEPVSTSVPSPSPVPSETAAAFAPPPAARHQELPLPNVPPLPHLADAFAALLAAEQGEPLPAGALWPAAEPAPAPPAVVSEETIDEITRRVLEKLSDSVVRQAVADVASTIAERLIREEIERIKAAIK